MPRSAMGIPNREVYGEHTALKPGEPVTISVQLHNAERAGKHFDFRVGTPETGLLSWATRKGVPRPGERYRYFEQPVHSYDYGTFEGVIPEGYGKGTVKLVRYGDVLITGVGPDYIRLAMSDPNGKTNRYLLRRIGKGDWLMMNLTPRIRVPGSKAYVIYIPKEKMSEVLKDISARDKVVKSRGVRAFVELMRKGAEILPADDGDIYTEKVVRQEARAKIPKDLVGSLVLAEIVGKKGDRYLTPSEVHSFLEMPVEESVRQQIEKGVELKVTPVDLLRLGKKKPPADPEERRRIALSLMRLFGAKMEPNEMKNMLAGANQTVYVLPEGKRQDVLFLPGKNQKVVYIKDYTLRMGAHGKPEVAEILYSTKPDGPVVGSFSKDIPKEIARKLALRPGKYIGRPVLISYAKELPGNRLRDPRFVKMAGENYNQAEDGENGSQT